MLWTILIVLVSLSFLFLVVGFISLARNKAKAGTDTENSMTGKVKKTKTVSWKISWWKRERVFNWLKLLIAWSFLYFAVRVFAPTMWEHDLFNSGTAWFLIAGLTLFGMMMAPAKHPFIWKLSKIGAFIFVVLAFGYLLNRNMPTIKNWFGPEVVKAKTFFVRVGNTNGFLARNTETEIVTRKFWKSTDDISDEQQDAMIEHARLESNFNQFRPDGTPYYSVPRNPEDDTTAVGVMQVKESVWSEEALRHKWDLKTLDGNLQFSLWLVKKRIAEGKRFDVDWDSTTKVLRIALLAGDGWSDQIKTFGDFSATSDGPISVLLDETIVVDDKPTTRTTAPCARVVRFKSRSDKPVNVVTFVRKFTECR